MRLSLFYWLYPSFFVDDSFDWSSLDIERWSDTVYRWEQDDWNGMKDTVQDPQFTIETGTGDCDDYSLVATSYLTQTIDHDVRVAAMFSYDPLLGHMVTYDATAERVYSSGEIVETTLEQFVSDSKYDWYVSRKV